MYLYQYVHCIFAFAFFCCGLDEEEGGGTGDHALSRGRLESTTLEEQMQFLEEKLSLLRAQKSGGNGLYACIHVWDRFREKGPNAYIIKFPVCTIEM